MFDGEKFTRMNKSSLVATEMTHSLNNWAMIYQIVGTDRYAYAVRENTMLLLQIGTSELTLLDEANNEASNSIYTRTLIAAYSRSGVSFIIMLEEMPCGISLYSSYRKKLFCQGYQVLDLPPYNRILGGMYDPEKDRVIMCMETYKSQVVKLTY